MKLHIEQLESNLTNPEPLYRLVNTSTKEVLLQTTNMQEVLSEATRLENENESKNSRVSTTRSDS